MAKDDTAKSSSGSDTTTKNGKSATDGPSTAGSSKNGEPSAVGARFAKEAQANDVFAAAKNGGNGKDKPERQIFERLIETRSEVRTDANSLLRSQGHGNGRDSLDRMTDEEIHGLLSQRDFSGLPLEDRAAILEESQRRFGNTV